MSFKITTLIVLFWELAACSPYEAGTFPSTQEASQSIDTTVSIGTHRLYINCLGTGSPTVVIDTDLGDASEKWRPIQREVSRDTRVCIYDRAGYGRSEPGPMPRHSLQVASELKQLLDNAGVGGTYLLVGHALGSLNMQVFASQYPDRVAGMVLVDPPPIQFITGERFPEVYQVVEQQTNDLWEAAEAAYRTTDPAEKVKATYFETLASEQAMMLADSAKQVAAITSFGDIPVTVLVAGKLNPTYGASAATFQQFWIEQNQELAKKSRQGIFILAEESGHNLHLDVPDLVIEAIRQMLEKARESQ
jgi:pimeloyl-ACP methyl ester carboxylesterase